MGQPPAPPARLASHATIWPGHDYGARPSSTLDWERRFNPFRSADLASFLRLKRFDRVSKARHGLM